MLLKIAASVPQVTGDKKELKGLCPGNYFISFKI
jgi:hypothetical protein